MYTIKVDGNLLYDPFIADQGYSVLNPKITYEMNKAGSLELIVPPNNVNIGAIHKLKSIVQVFDNGKEIFRGRVLHDETDFYKRKSVYCEGELAFLLDSIVRSYDYQGNFDGLFTQLIENHNSQVDDDKKFIVGEITVKDKNDYIHYSSTQYPTTWDEINEKLIKTHGGYLRTRLDNGIRYIDYINDYTNVSNQTIEFGKNMIDLTEYMSAEDIFTVLIPIGSEIKDESGETSGRVTIESVNEGKDYIQDDNAIALFGKIVKTQKWDSVSQPDNLLYKAREYLASGVQVATTITIKAVNLNLLDVNIDSIKLGDYCRVISKPHGLDKMFQCSKVVIDLTNPLNSVYTFGLNLKSMTDIQIDNDSDMKEIIENTSESNKSEFDQKITDAKKVFKDEIAEAVKKINGGTSGHVVLVLNDKGETNELYAFDGDSLLTAKKLLRLNYEGIAGTDEGYNGDFKLAISTDGKINAEQLVVGIIRDALGKNFWNLETGEFSLTGYATDDELSNGISDANTYSDQQAQGALDTAKSYADTGDSSTLISANSTAQSKANTAESNAKSYADNKVSSLNTALTQAEIFNRLTNNGQTQGIYLSNGKLYINADYLKSGTIKGITIEGVTITGSTLQTAKSLEFVNQSGYKTTLKNDISLRGDGIDDLWLKGNGGFYSNFDHAISFSTGDIGGGRAGKSASLTLTPDAGDHACAMLESRGNLLYMREDFQYLQLTNYNDGSIYGRLYINNSGNVWLTSKNQMVVSGNGNTFIKSIGNNLYLQARTSDDNGTNAYVYVQKDGKVQIGSSGNKNTYINGYPAVRINGAYHDIFFQWNGASLIATVDVTQVWSTSDRRLKDQIETISDDYIDAIGSAEIKQFIFTDEIYDKSIKHFGVIAQDVREALESKGINPEEIAVNNHFDRDGEEYYGIDKEEFLMARIAYDEKKIKMLEERIEKLEKLILKES